MTQNNHKIPVIGITMGDPAGIGPEIIVKALADAEIRKLGKFIIYGMDEFLEYSADLAELDVFWWRDQHERINRYYPQSVVIADYDEISWPNYFKRNPSRLGGQASMRFLTDAVDDARSGKIDAIVTAPISKESWQLAGYK